MGVNEILDSISTFSIKINNIDFIVLMNIDIFMNYYLSFAN